MTMRVVFSKSSLIVMLMILIVSATVTMGWTSRAADAHGASIAADSPDHALQDFVLLSDARGNRSIPLILTGGDGNTCCACDRTTPAQLPGRDYGCTSARISPAASLLQPLDLEPPQAPPRT